MADNKELKATIQELYPDIRKFGLELIVSRQGFPSTTKYQISLAKDTRKATFIIGSAEVDACLGGRQCSLIVNELEGFLRQFLHEEHSIPEAG